MIIMNANENIFCLTVNSCTNRNLIVVIFSHILIDRELIA